MHWSRIGHRRGGAEAYHLPSAQGHPSIPATEARFPCSVLSRAPKGDITALSRNLLPANPSFAGHQTFAVRAGWLKKGMDALQNPQAGASSVFSREDALVALGVGKNMVQSIRHWLLAFRLAEESGCSRGRELLPTPIGRSLFGDLDGSGWDPFLEDAGTLWLLHWLLAGPGGPAFTWIWTFNLFREYEFTRESLTDAVLSATASRMHKALAPETAKRDVDCLLHTYSAGARAGTVAAEEALDCPLQMLGLIQPMLDHRFQFDIGPKRSLPGPVVDYALTAFWQWWSPMSPALSVRDIVYAEGSPGLVFKLDEDSVLEYLDGLGARTHGALAFEDAVLERQVVRQRDLALDPIPALERFYA